MAYRDTFTNAEMILERIGHQDGRIPPVHLVVRNRGAP